MEYSEWKDEIKAVPMEEVCDLVGVEYRRQGSLYSILCPNPSHNDRNYGSCFIKNGHYNCYACGDHGDNIRLVQQVKMLPYQDAVNMIARYANIPLWDEITYQQSSNLHLPLTGKQCKVLGLVEHVKAQCITNLSDMLPEPGISWVRDLEGYATYEAVDISLMDIYEETELTENDRDDNEDGNFFYEMVIGKLFYRLQELLLYYLTEDFSDVSEQEAVENDIETILPLAYKYQKVAKKYGYDLSFVSQYKKKAISQKQTKSLSKFKFKI